MTAEEFEGAVTILFGGYHAAGAAKAATFLNISQRSIRAMMAGERPVPEGVAEELRTEARLAWRDGDFPSLVFLRQALEQTPDPVP